MDGAGSHKTPSAMKTFLAIAALILLAANLFLGVVGTDILEERNAARAERDSVLNGWNASVQELTALRAHTDSLRAYTDSVVMAYPPAPVVIRRALKTFEYAPLGMAVDTLSAE